ncbi:MAG: hypothetical protein KGL39_02720 [Patescibacteria group bacterium]|nr:hypothetical protein [Patescibacteria group bacterium]
MSNTAEQSKAYRAAKMAQGLCINGCGQKSTRGDGLCAECGDKARARANARYRRLHPGCRRYKVKSKLNQQIQ